jgi:hypothetical protein
MGHLSIVKLLLQDSRIDASSRCNLGIKVAYANGHKDIVSLYIKHLKINKDPNSW